MVDSIAVLDVGTRILDGAGDPISGATLEFYAAGTSNALTVYSDKDLSTSLGSVVYCDSDGAPVSASGGSTKVAIYIGTDSHKIVIKDGSGSIVETKDNLAGALDTSAFDDGSIAIPKFPMISKSEDYTVVAGDRGKVINVDPTGGDVTITLLSAVTAGDGWAVLVRHVGSANKVILQTVSNQTISLPLAGGAATAFEMVSYGESLLLGSDAANWHPLNPAIGLKLGSGYHSTVYDHGTVVGGTVTPDPEEGNLQKVTNGGAFTLGEPAENTGLVLQVTNNASAGAIDTTAYDKVTGDTIATTDGYIYKFYVNVIDGQSHLAVVGMQ